MFLDRDNAHDGRVGVLMMCAGAALRRVRTTELRRLHASEIQIYALCPSRGSTMFSGIV